MILSHLRRFSKTTRDFLREIISKKLESFSRYGNEAFGKIFKKFETPCISLERDVFLTNYSMIIRIVYGNNNFDGRQKGANKLKAYKFPRQ